MSRNEAAISAAKKLTAQDTFSATERDRLLAQREDLYAVVQSEHKVQTDSIHVPNHVDMKNVSLDRTERLFLWYLNGKRTDIRTVGVYWYIEYHMYDYQACVQKLFDGGYLECATPSNSLNFLKADELKTILRNANLPTSGTKAALCARIRSALPAEYINDRYPHFQTFACTEQGKRLIDESSAIIYFHQHKMRLPVSFGFEDVERTARVNIHTFPGQKSSARLSLPDTRKLS